MRTNIDLDEDLIHEAQELTGLRTKRAVVEEALRVLVRLNQQEGVRRLRGKVTWTGDLEASRLARHADPR